jgi:hypothetical protein
MLDIKYIVDITDQQTKVNIELLQRIERIENYLKIDNSNDSFSIRDPLALVILENKQ